MRTYGRIETSFWQNPKVRALSSDESRHLLLYLYTCPHGNSLSCGRFASVTIPDDVIEIQIFTDRDDEGEQAAQKAKDHFLNMGKRVAIRRPPQGCSDWNDALPKWRERPVEDWEF